MGWQKLVIQECLFAVISFAAFFMLLVSLAFLLPRSVQVDRLIARHSRKGYLYLIAIAIGLIALSILKLVLR